jgi:5'-3' exonuclease
MGVPGFVKWLSKKKKLNSSFKASLNHDCIVDTLYIDANCLFHPQCFKTLAQLLSSDKASSTSVSKLENAMIKRILLYLDYIIDEANPKSRVFISVDGVAPKAKMNQQRQRRFKGIEDKHFEDELKIKHGKQIYPWSNVVITPGTEFMENLHEHLIYYVKSKKDKREYIYSSYHEAGEGEHKILEHIRERKHLSDVYVIYGLDADLVSLSIASQKNNIFLLREIQHYGKFAKTNKEINEIFEVNAFDIAEEFNYMDIDELKKTFTEFMSEAILEINKSFYFSSSFSTSVINDFIVYLILLGNDFIPHIPSIHVNTNGIDVIIDAYLKTLNFMNTKFSSNFLVTYNNEKNNVTINQKFLSNMLKNLSLKETNYFEYVLPKYKEKTSTSSCPFSSDYEREKWNYDMLKDEKIIDNIRFGVGASEEWKFRYYAEYFHCDEFYEDTVYNASLKFFEGFFWVTKYYFEGCPSFSWQYPYTHTPFISDLSSFLYDNALKFNINSFKFKHNVILTPCQQLLAVMPPIYSNVLPFSYQKLFKSGSSIEKFYPHIYKIDYVNRFMRHEAVPLISPVDIDEIIKATKSLPLTEKELIRNNFESKLIYQSK